MDLLDLYDPAFYQLPGRARGSVETLVSVVQAFKRGFFNAVTARSTLETDIGRALDVTEDSQLTTLVGNVTTPDADPNTNPELKTVVLFQNEVAQLRLVLSLLEQEQMDRATADSILIALFT